MTPCDFLVAPCDFLVAPGDFLVAPGDFLVAPGDLLVAPGDLLHVTRIEAHTNKHPFHSSALCRRCISPLRFPVAFPYYVSLLFFLFTLVYSTGSLPSKQFVQKLLGCNVRSTLRQSGCCSEGHATSGAGGASSHYICSRCSM